VDHQPAQHPPHPQPWHREPEPWNGKTNGFAIASLTMSLLGCSLLLSAAFGVIALRQTKRNGDRRGRRFAIAGLTICGLWVLAIAVALVVHIAQGPDRDDTGAVRGERSMAVADLRAGDCLKDLINESGNYVDVVPCSTAHSSEVFARFALPAGAWPGDAQVEGDADAGCDRRFEAYSGVKPDDDDAYVLFAAPPDELNWPSDRGVLCLAHHRGSSATGSLRR
jgi:hypothetical protein